MVPNWRENDDENEDSGRLQDDDVRHDVAGA